MLVISSYKGVGARQTPREAMAPTNERDPSHVDASNNAIAPSNAPIAAPKRAPPSMVPAATIEAWVAGFLWATVSAHAYVGAYAPT